MRIRDDYSRTGLSQDYLSKELSRALDGKKIMLEEHGDRVFKIELCNGLYIREVISGPSRLEWEIAATPGFTNFNPMPRSYRDFMVSPKRTKVLYWEIHKRGQKTIPMLGNYRADWSCRVEKDVGIYMDWAKNRLNRCLGEFGQKLLTFKGNEQPRYSKRI